MNAELLSAFDALASRCDVSAALCEAAGQGELDMPLDLHAICTRIGLPQARAEDLERSLISGKNLWLIRTVNAAHVASE